VIVEAFLGPEVASHPAKRPERVVLEGRYVTLAPLDASVHGEALWQAVGGADKESLWVYMPDGPFPSRESLDAVLQAKTVSEDPLFFAILDRATGLAAGHASFMRIDPKNRVVEVGGIMFSPALQGTRGATEAMYLMARHAFEELGYRRYEWKCNSLNEPSRRAALRLGFQFEGIFRQHMIIKGRNRDTAWFSLLSSEWPARKQAFERWLDPGNFDSKGIQRHPLSR
jgi:RimJ/RimL family protein N-acetyltransferase